MFELVETEAISGRSERGTARQTSASLGYWDARNVFFGETYFKFTRIFPDRQLPL